MDFRNRLPLSLRLRLLRGLRPLREAQMQIQERRGLSFGRHISDDGASTNGHAPMALDANRLERYFDSHAVGPGIEKWRHYFEIYERHFASFVGREVYVVEIGISSGGSLQMWLDYFGAGCHVYGVDIDPACKAHEAESIRVCIGDQADPRFWTWFLREIPRIDILIDDGGHSVDQQVTTFESLFTHIEPGGVYLCEDIHGTDNAFSGYISGLARNLHCWDGLETTGFQRAVGGIHLYPYVTVIDRPRSPRLELPAQRRGTQWRPGL